MFHDPLRWQASLRRHRREFAECLRRRVFRVKDDRAAELLRLLHRVSEKVVTCREDLRGDREVRTADLSEGNRFSVRDQAGGPINPLSHRFNRGLKAERLSKSDEFHRIRPEGHEDLQVRRFPDRRGHGQRLREGSVEILPAVDGHILVGRVRQHDRRPAHAFELFRRLDA